MPPGGDPALEGPSNGHRAYENCLPIHPLDPKPRERGLTMVRDPGMGMRALEDLCEASGDFVDVLKVACGVMRVQPLKLTLAKIQRARASGIDYSTGGVLERVLMEGSAAVHRFLAASKDYGFAEIEVSSGVVILSLEDKLEVIRAVHEYGLRPVPEVSMAYGLAPGQKSTVNADKLVHEVLRCLEAGAPRVLIEEEGLTQNVDQWREEIVFKIAASCPLEKLVFEVENRTIYSWYIKHFGPRINLHIDPFDVNHLQVTRCGVWGKGDTWGRVATFHGEADNPNTLR